MPRRTHPPLLAAALATGLLLAVGVAACGGDSSQSAGTLETPPLTVGTGSTIPSTSTTSTTRTTSTTSTTDTDVDNGGAIDPDTPDTGGAVDPDTGDTGADTGGDTGGGGAPSTGGGDTGDTPEPSNPGGAAPDYDDFCNENPGAC